MPFADHKSNWRTSAPVLFLAFVVAEISVFRAKRKFILKRY